MFMLAPVPNRFGDALPDMSISSSVLGALSVLRVLISIVTFIVQPCLLASIFFWFVPTIGSANMNVAPEFILAMVLALLASVVVGSITEAVLSYMVWTRGSVRLVCINYRGVPTFWTH